MTSFHQALEEAHTVALIGLGREGKSFLRYCGGLGSPKRFVVIDDRPLGPDDLDAFSGYDITALSPQDARMPEALKGIDAAFRSPGISIHKHPVLQKLANRPVTTSVNLWCERFLEARKIMISGTKGKSTVSSLLHHVLSTMGYGTVLGGNIGVPLLDIEPGADFSVLELSSYQIADLAYAPECAVLLNLYPEHTDWHGSVAQYYKDKCRLITDLAPRIAIINGADENLKRHVPSSQVTACFGMPEGFHVAGDGIRFGDRAFDVRTRLPGRHNKLNICAVLEVLHSLKLIEADAPLPDVLLKAIAAFQPLAHRLEELGEYNGCLYVNDSISTTPETVLAALDVYRGRPVTLLIGGYDRGQDYTKVIEAVRSPGVNAVLTLPDNGARIAEACREALGEDTSKCIPCGSLSEAMTQAARLTPQGGVVLLSPGAPSYGHFRSFEERGEQFRKLAGMVSTSTESAK